MTKQIFHGSERIIECPRHRGGKPYNDYGYGFYCTEIAAMAKEWAVTEDHDGFSNRYELNTDGLSTLYLNRDYSILSWLTVLLNNRRFSFETPLAREAANYLTEHFSIDTEAYDLIYGYRADDSYFSFAQDFISGSISYEQLTRAMYLGEMGMQLVLKSRKAFDQIRFVQAERVLRSEWLDRKMIRDIKARASYLDSDRMKYRPKELYITTILDEEMKDGDPRLS